MNICNVLQKPKKHRFKHKIPISKEIIESESESSESDADNIPLSVLRERPSTPGNITKCHFHKSESFLSLKGVII